MHSHTEERLTQLGPTWSNSVKRHIQYNRVQQTTITDIQKVTNVLMYFQRSDYTFMMYIEAFFKRVFSLSQSFSGTFMWMADVSSNLFLLPHCCLKSHPFGLCDFFLFSFCCFCSLLNLLEEIWVIFHLFLSTSYLSNKCPGNRLAKKILYLAGGWDQISKFCPHPKVSPPVHIQIHFKKLKRNKGGNDYTYKHSCLNGNIFLVFKIELELIFLIDSTWPLSY